MLISDESILRRYEYGTRAAPAGVLVARHSRLSDRTFAGRAREAALALCSASEEQPAAIAQHSKTDAG